MRGLSDWYGSWKINWTRRRRRPCPRWFRRHGWRGCDLGAGRDRPRRDGTLESRKLGGKIFISGLDADNASLRLIAQGVQHGQPMSARTEDIVDWSYDARAKPQGVL
jgi:hypothetical protein